MSYIRSASSTVKISMSESTIVREWMWSMSRPGVATRTLGQAWSAL